MPHRVPSAGQPEAHNFTLCDLLSGLFRFNVTRDPRDPQEPLIRLMDDRAQYMDRFFAVMLLVVSVGFANRHVKMDTSLLLGMVVALACEATDTYYALVLALPLLQLHSVPPLIVLGVAALFYVQGSPWSHCMWHLLAGCALRWVIEIRKKDLYKPLLPFS